MVHSYSRETQCTCPGCGQPFSCRVYVLIDAVERPDLLRRVRDDSIHSAVCPSCRGSVTVPAPILIYRPGARTPLVFSPAEDASPEDIPRQSRELLDILRARLGAEFRSDWGLQTTLRMSLRDRLDDADDSEGDEAEEAPDAPPSWADRIGALFAAKTSEEKRRVVDEYPELLGDDTRAALEHNLRRARQRGQNGFADIYEEHLALLDALRGEEAPSDASDRAGRGDGSQEGTAIDGMPDVPSLAPALKPRIRRLAIAVLSQSAEPNDLHKSVALCRQTLSLIDPEVAPVLWAALQNRLGSVHLRLGLGRSPEEVELAVEAFQNALVVVQPDMPLAVWSTAFSGLAQAYQERAAGDPAQNYEFAIEACKEGLAGLAPDAAPDLRRPLQDSLGSAYTDRILGDRAENRDLAVEAYREALEGLSPDEPDDRDEWTLLTHNLGRALFARINGDRSQNIDQAIAAYDAVLAIVSKHARPDDWALCQNNLAAAMLERIAGDRAENVERAIAALEGALRVWTPQTAPLQWARATSNLGTAYAARGRGDRAANLERAIQAFHAVEPVLPRAADPPRWAELQMNLGTALSERVAGDPADNLREAIAALERALGVYQPRALPTQCRVAAFKLGSLRARAGDLPAAYAAFRTGADAAETLYRWAYVPGSERIETQINADLYDALVGVCLRLKDDPEYARRGLVSAEEGKARTFLTQMGQSGFPPPPDAPPALLEREGELIGRLQQLEQALIVPAASEDQSRRLTDERRAARAELGGVWDALGRECPSASEYLRLRRGQCPTWEEFRDLASRLGPNAALVELCVLDDAVALFVLRCGWESPRVFTAPVSRRALLNRYLLNYREEVLNHAEFERSGRRATRGWLALGEELFAPLEDSLEGVGTLYLVPHGWLHTVPLHALTVHGAPLIRRRAVVYGPSAGILVRVLAAAEARPAGSAGLVMGYTPGRDAGERELFLGEARAVAAELGCGALLDDDASTAALRARAASADVIHLSCHGIFDREDPLASGVRLADGDVTAREWMRLRTRADLVTLSACESGFSEVGRGDELTGLAHALLYAGASSALLTLWSVSALTTRAWMTDFYGRLRGGGGRQRVPIALAFQQATCALLDRNSDPYYWAPYVLTGDWR